MTEHICWGEVYCHRGIPMLKTRIQLPAVWGGQPAAWMLSLARLTENYAEQTLLPAIREVYDGLPTVAEKMHFEPCGYRHMWHASPHPDSSRLLTVRIETVLYHGGTELGRDERLLAVSRESGDPVRKRIRAAR